MSSAPMSLRTHSVVLTHEEFRAILIAIDQSVYPGHDGTPIGVELYKQLTVLHERLWEEFTKR